MSDTIPQETPQKQCSKCENFFPATTQFFGRDKTKIDGLYSSCKICKKAWGNTYRAAHPDIVKQNYHQHKEAYRERQRRNEIIHRDERQAYRQAHKEKLNQRSRDYNKLHKEQLAQQHKAWRKAHKEEFNQKRKAYYATHKEEINQKRKEHDKRIKEIARNHGLTYEQWMEAYDRQNGCCAICLIPFKNEADTHTDHCHQKGHFRGILCRKCNIGIGMLNEDPMILLRAYDYLK